MTVRALYLLLALWLTAAACSSGTAVADADVTVDGQTEAGETEAAPAPADADATDDEAARLTASTEGPTVTLTDPGAEPRAELRLRLADETGVVEMTQTQSLTQFIDGQEMTSTGQISSTTEIEYEIEAGGGNYAMTTRYLSMRAADGSDPGVADAVARTGETLRSLETVATIDDRGFLVASETTGVDTLPDDMLALVQELIDNEQLTSPLPEEPVGIGATWEIRTSMVLNGAPTNQVTVMEVISIEGDIVTLRATGGQTVALGPITMPGVPAETDVEVLAWDVTVEGESVIDLTKPMATSMMTVTGRQSLQISDGNESIVLDQDVLQRLELR